MCVPTCSVPMARPPVPTCSVPLARPPVPTCSVPVARPPVPTCAVWIFSAAKAEHPPETAPAAVGTAGRRQGEQTVQQAVQVLAMTVSARSLLPSSRPLKGVQSHYACWLKTHNMREDFHLHASFGCCMDIYTKGVLCSFDCELLVTGLHTKKEPKKAVM